jgi:DNA polymerase-3 subunit gamma/tau
LSQSSEVLARKYRPKKFEDIIGQEAVSNTLSLALDTKRLSHAYLFSGLRGSGKTSTARIFSKALLCDHGPTSKPCEVCQNCTMANENRHIDIVELDAASNRKIDDIRDLIEQSKYKPAIARYKIFIIDEVHMLTKEAFNALLKTLEEPPDFIKFILATTDPLKLPATILSRTQHFRFKSIAKVAVLNHLEHILNKEQIPYSVDALEIIVRSGNGSLRDTLTLLDQAIIYSKKRLDINSVTDMLGLIDPKFIDDLFEAIFEKDIDKVKNYLNELDSYDTETVLDEIIEYLKDKLLTSDVKFPALLVDRFFRVLNDSKYLLSINADSSFVLILTMLKMSEALKIKDINDIISDLEDNIEDTTPTKKIKVKPIEKAPTEDTQSQDSTQSKFELLIKSIYDRNVEIGDCFKNSIEFVSYENNTLSWISNADDTCKQRLKTGYSVIKHIVQEVYGIGTKINLVQPKNTNTNDIVSRVENIVTPEPIVELKQNQDTPIHIIEEVPIDIPQEPTQNIQIDNQQNIDNSEKIGIDRAFMSQGEVDNHELVKSVKDIFGHDVGIHVKKGN